MQEKRYLKIVTLSAWYDLVITGILAIPFTSILLIGFLNTTHTFLNLPGVFGIFEPIHLLFVNLMGIVSFFWAILRIKHTSILLGYYDGLIRLSLAVLMAFYMLYYQVSLVIVSFFFVEVIFGLLQIVFYYKLKK
ncbi:hypothetical protein A9Q91_01705 [Candidatus Gracilibacteria bacterium 28_42_T64]|nr:hypothetical protein A9Q91_01705 [Candidatus Gracilibacteria bacterium 28_42_T64]